MQKTTLLLLTLIGSLGFAQQKSTGVMTLSNNPIPITANFTLDNTTSQVTLVLTGPSDRWFGLGIGVEEGFGMAAGDVVVFTTSTTPNLTDRRFAGFSNPPVDAVENWTINSNSVSGTVRTLTLTRPLTTGDSNDFQMPYASTNSISIAGARPSSATFSVGPHGGVNNVGYATATFQTLNTDDINLNTVQLFPNPSKNFFNVSARSPFTNVTIYSQTGQLVRTLTFENGSTEERIATDDLATGIYLLEVSGTSGKAWKKLIKE
jgi:hypothetical protein